MALTGVLRPGHVQVRVLDMAEAKHFYSNVLGLVETGTDAQGRVYYKAWDERDHNSVVLRQVWQLHSRATTHRTRRATTGREADSCGQTGQCREAGACPG